MARIKHWLHKTSLHLKHGKFVAPLMLEIEEIEKESESDVKCVKLSLLYIKLANEYLRQESYRVENGKSSLYHSNMAKLYHAAFEGLSTRIANYEEERSKEIVIQLQNELKN